MRVICIDSSKREYSDNSSKDICEGVVYTVTDSWLGVITKKPYYSIHGFDCIKGIKGFRQDRFIPCSEQDEMGLVLEENQTQLHD